MWLVKRSPRSHFPQFYLVMLPHSVLIELRAGIKSYLTTPTKICRKKLINKESVQVILSDILLYSPTSAVF